jgi:integrase
MLVVYIEGVYKLDLHTEADKPTVYVSNVDILQRFYESFIKNCGLFIRLEIKPLVNEMTKFDIVETWLNNVAASHSASKSTEYGYRHNFDQFLTFIETTSQQILTDYDNMDERTFKRKYTMMVKAWISELQKKAYSPNTIIAKTTPLISFFKYNDLPLGFIPTLKARILYHNRDITKDEIIKIIDVSRARERAFFTMMAQSGLRPDTLCKLKQKHIEPDFSLGKIPCAIMVPQEIAKGKYQEYFTFMGEESVKALKAYFATRPDMTGESPIFAGYGKESNIKRTVWIFTTKFREALQTLRNKGEIQYEDPKEGKPATLRLYTLRKWFRKMAHQAGFEIVQYWMGHVVKTGVEESYRPRDIEFHRKLYAEKAMPFLRLESTTPLETEETMMELRKQLELEQEARSRERGRLEKEIEELKQQFQNIQKQLREMTQQK